jgi:hypothetical protein
MNPQTYPSFTCSPFHPNRIQVSLYPMAEIVHPESFRQGGMMGHPSQSLNPLFPPED